ncbi:MAG: hypothetical protein NT143_06145 [Actinobacteria bacterium]|nr:hypothetical protein [Actinomycetota bacterium]
MTITINRPESRGALRGRTILALCGAFERAGDDEIMVVLVAGGDAPNPKCGAECRGLLSFATTGTKWAPGAPDRTGDTRHDDRS